MEKLICVRISVRNDLEEELKNQIFDEIKYKISMIEKYIKLLKHWFECEVDIFNNEVNFNFPLPSDVNNDIYDKFFNMFLSKIINISNKLKEVIYCRCSSLYNFGGFSLVLYFPYYPYTSFYLIKDNILFSIDINKFIITKDKNMCIDTLSVVFSRITDKEKEAIEYLSNNIKKIVKIKDYSSSYDYLNDIISYYFSKNKLYINRIKSETLSKYYDLKHVIYDANDLKRLLINFIVYTYDLYNMYKEYLYSLSFFIEIKENEIIFSEFKEFEDTKSDTEVDTISENISESLGKIYEKLSKE